ncbi:MAG: LysE family translocator [Chloroflexi bacterium]|nr:LysE family translocator [Chloroflexota bacterium]
MLDWTELLTIATVSWLGIMSPGPDFVVVVRHSVSYGRRHGLTAALGVTTGTVVPLAYATFGAALLATQSDLVYLILQYAGSAYLAWLGFRALRSRPAPPDLDPLRLASPDTPDTDLEASPMPTEVPTRLRTFWTGVLITSLNAKAGLFYLSLFAMAVSANTPVAPRLLYCAYILISTMIWTSVVATLFGCAPPSHDASPTQPLGFRLVPPGMVVRCRMRLSRDGGRYHPSPARTSGSHTTG